jgi:hypothetical protein
MSCKFLFSFLIILLPFGNNLSAQVYGTLQSISGVINTYTKVTAIGSATSITVTSSTGFAVSNKALLIQMQGATVNTGENANFGIVSAIGSAGNYEVVTISNVAGNVITLANAMSKTYVVAGNVQLVTIPEYNGGATVSGTLTAQAWNGTTGGVVVLYGSTITLNADIDATAKGFRRGSGNGGGGSCYNPGYAYTNGDTHRDTIWSYGSVAITCANGMNGSPAWTSVCNAAWRSPFSPGCGCYVTVAACNNIPVYDSAVYKVGQNFSCSGKTGYYTSNSTMTGGDKGEGIALPITGKTAGRAPISNGGGGGNEHNGGGGGGSNYGKGGLGGMDLSDCYSGLQTTPINQKDSLARGFGGISLSPYYNCRVFMGGGAGSGQGNDNQNTPGVEGGGIILIKATTLANSGGFKIMANGMTNNLPANTGGAASAGADGAGGGGGGGAVLLDIGTYSSATVIEAKGGKGGDNVLSSPCYAPGGGGGGGAIWYTQVSTPANSTPAVTGGLSGLEILNGVSTTSACNGGDYRYGARAGANGGILYNLVIPTNGTGCAALPINLIDFTAVFQNNKVEIQWTTFADEAKNIFVLEKSIDGVSWELLQTMSSKGDNTTVNEYSYSDTVIEPGIFYYRLKIIDGTEILYSGISKVKIFNKDNYSIYPNPATEKENKLFIKSAFWFSHEVHVTISDISGRTICSEDILLTAQRTYSEINTGKLLSKGIYLVVIRSDQESTVLKWVVE